MRLGKQGGNVRSLVFWKVREGTEMQNRKHAMQMLTNLLRDREGNNSSRAASVAVSLAHFTSISFSWLLIKPFDFPSSMPQRRAFTDFIL